MSSEHIKRAIRLGWDEMSESYQAETFISLSDVHYAPLCPGERELSILGDVGGLRTLGIGLRSSAELHCARQMGRARNRS